VRREAFEHKRNINYAANDNCSNVIDVGILFAGTLTTTKIITVLYTLTNNTVK